MPRWHRFLLGITLLVCAWPSAPTAQRHAGAPPPTDSPGTIVLFRVHPPRGDAPLDVRFEDRSYGDITSWRWDFGDGTGATVQHPHHVYTEGGVYAVRLTVSGPTGTGTLERPEAVTVRRCVTDSARANRVTPLELGEEFVPITGDDSLGFYCVYSGKAVGPNNPGVANNVAIFVVPLAGGEVLLFGAGYGDANSLVTPTADASHDVRRIDAILRFCLDRSPATTPIRFVAPHGHIDHVNADFMRELRVRGYPLVDIAFHAADANLVRSLPGWTNEDRALFRVLRNATSQCQEELESFDSPLGRLWFYLRDGHTPGSIDLVIDVRGDPTNRFIVRGSGEAFGACALSGVREAIEPHGNILFTAPAPELFSASPAHASSLGGTVVTLSGANFAAHLAGVPTVLFDGNPASAVTVVADGTLTCVPPPGQPGTSVGVVLVNRSGMDALPGSFSYRPLPTVTSLSPTRGLATGGTRVTLHGSGFQAFAPGTNSVTFGGVPATQVQVRDDRALTCTTPAHASGLVDVGLGNLNGSAELAQAFLYDPVIDVTSVSPASGSALGGTRVELSGSAFAVGASVPEVFFGAARATDVVRLGDTRMRCTTPSGPAGNPVNVRVTGENGSDTLANGYRYFVEPKVTAVSPASGPEAGGTAVTVTGNNFTRNSAGANTVLFGGAAASGVVTLSDTAIQCVAPSGTGGTSVDVTVANANGSGTLAAGYRYHRPPRLDALAPVLGPHEGGTLVRVTGAGFLETGAGVTAVTFGGAPASELVIDADGGLTCRTPPGAGDGSADVEIVNANGRGTLPQAFRYVTRPTLTSLLPSSGPSRGGTLVTVRGAGFLAQGSGLTTVSFGGRSGEEVRVLDDTTLTCRTPLGVPEERLPLRLVNQNGAAQLAGAFTYLALPSLSTLTPSEGPLAGGTRVRVTGSGFQVPGGAPVIRFGASAAVGVTVLGAEVLECTTPPGPRGPASVSIHTPAGDAVLREAFVYGSTRLTLERVLPDHGPSQGGTHVELHGSNFTAGGAGSIRVTFGAVLATAVVAQNDGLLTCTAPAGASGASVDVRVSNQNGSAKLAAGYRYHLQPTLSSVGPASGSPLGGLVVTLTGSAFARDEAQNHLVRFGAEPASDLVVLDDSHLTCQVPPGTAGTSVDVELTHSNGTARLPAAFQYLGAPRLEALAPTSGGPLGGTAVTLTGSGFTLEGAGVTSVRFGASAAAQVVVVSDTEVTCLAPPGSSGAQVDVELQNANGASVLGAAYRYFVAPTIASLAPTNGPATGGTTVVITGRGFRTDVAGANGVTFGGRAARSVTTVDDTRVRAVAPIGPAGQSVDLVLTNSNGSAAVPLGFRYHATPTLTSFDPAGASALGGDVITLHGSGFQQDGPGTNLVHFGSSTAVSVQVVDDQTLTCSLPAGASGTDVTVSVQNNNGSASAATPFRYFAAPTLGELVPPYGFSGGGDLVELHGTGWSANGAGQNDVWFGASVASEVTVLDDLTLRCRAPAGVPGPVEVRVDNANGSTLLAGGYYYDWAPTITSIQPTHGTSLGGTEVRVDGGGFSTPGAGTLVIRFGATPAKNVRVLDGFTLLCDTPPGPAGSPVSVTVSNSRGSSSLGGFQYHARPTLSTIDPATGPPEGGTLVTLRGSGFVANSAGTPTIRFSGSLASAVSVVDDGTLRCRTPAGTARTTATVTLDNANGSATFADAYRWIRREPTDLNDDGFSDVFVSGVDGVYVFFGAALGLSDESTTTADLVLRPTVAGTDFGVQLAAGDLNADSLADLAIGAPLDDVAGADAGAVFVFFGPLASSPTPRSASSANAVFRGAAAGDQFGASLAVAHVGGDATGDLLVGAPFQDAGGDNGGAVYAYRGGGTFSSQTTAQATVRLLASGAQHNFGAALAAGDVTGDDLADVLVGAPFEGASGGNSGAAYVFRGGASLVSTTSAGATVQIAGANSNDRFGSSVAAADLDGDGTDELVVGATDFRGPAGQTGAVYCFRGGVGLVSGSATAAQARLDGEVSGDRLGQALALGDASGDGRADVLLAAPQQDVPAANAGRAYLVLGGPLLGGSISARAAMIILAENSAGDQFGTGLGLVDVDGDDRADLLVGAPFSNGGGNDAGRLYVFYGAALQASRSAGADDATLTGAGASVNLGRKTGSLH